MARCASAAPAYGSGAYRAFLAALAAGWCVVLLRGFRQCFKELKRFRRAKRSRDHLPAHLPFGVGAAFFLVAALRVGYCARLFAAARGPACGEDAALHDAAEPLLLVALSSISLYWWQLAESRVARMAPGKLEGKFLAAFVAFNVVFCASGVVAALLARRSDALAARVRAADAALASAAYAAQGLAYVAFGRALVRRLDASLRRMTRASGERRSSSKAPERLARLRRRVTILYGVCGVGGVVLGALVALASRRGDQDARTFWLYAVALPAVELPVAALASFLGFRTNYDELDVARSRSIYERAGARLSAAGRRLSGLVALPRLRSAGSGSDPPLGSPQVRTFSVEIRFYAPPRRRSTSSCGRRATARRPAATRRARPRASSTSRRRAPRSTSSTPWAAGRRPSTPAARPPSRTGPRRRPRRRGRRRRPRRPRGRRRTRPGASAWPSSARRAPPRRTSTTANPTRRPRSPRRNVTVGCNM